MPYFAEKCKLKRRFKAKNQRDFFEFVQTEFAQLCRSYHIT